MMSGARKSKKYVSAGYTEKELYIAKDPAGSAKDNLRDLNKEGYRSERPWRDTPNPIFEEPYEERRQPPHRKVQQRELGFVDKLLMEIEHDKKGVAACALLFMMLMLMVTVWGQKMVSGVRLQQDINSYQTRTSELQKENETLSQQLEAKINGENIRIQAQNNLDMLRRERVQTETIYIQVPETRAQEEVQQTSQNHMEILDFFLGLLNVFHIGE